MSNEIIIVKFDYTRLDEDTASKLRYYAQSGNALVRKSMIQFIANFGQILSDAKKLLASHGDGTFCKWATSEFDLSRQTVYNYVNAWDKCLSNGLTNYDNITPTALYLLSKDDTPKSVRDQSLKLAHKQSTVTQSDVKKLLPQGVGRAPRKKKKPDYGKCPNCAGTKWDEDEEGVSCHKCHHPHGEPAGDVDDKELTTQRSKTIKTVEALMRAFDDLQVMRAKSEHAGAIESCKALLRLAKAWK